MRLTINQPQLSDDNTADEGVHVGNPLELLIAANSQLFCERRFDAALVAVILGIP